MSLCVQNLSFHYPDGGQRSVDGESRGFLLQDFSLALHPGYLLLLRGDSGTGKSTLCKILCGVIPQAVPGELQGDVLLDGVSIEGKSLTELSQSIGVVFQDPENQLFMPTVEHEIAFGLENLALDPAEIDRLLNQTIAALGLGSIRHKDPRRCSGGEKQRVVLAAVLAMDRPYLILDEVFAQADGEFCLLAREQMVRCKREGKGILLVDHRRIFDDLADEVVTLGSQAERPAN